MLWFVFTIVHELSWVDCILLSRGLGKSSLILAFFGTLRKSSKDVVFVIITLLKIWYALQKSGSSNIFHTYIYAAIKGQNTLFSRGLSFKKKSPREHSCIIALFMWTIFGFTTSSNSQYLILWTPLYTQKLNQYHFELIKPWPAWSNLQFLILTIPHINKHKNNFKSKKNSFWQKRRNDLPYILLKAWFIKSFKLIFICNILCNFC